MEKENYEEIVLEHLEYLKANKANINFRRDKEWKDSLPLDELASLEDELFFDKYLTVQEKSVLLKLEEGPIKPLPNCKHCSKAFKKVWLIGYLRVNNVFRCWN